MDGATFETLVRTRQTTAAICALPAVATLDWLDRAATALCEAAPESVCVMILAPVDRTGAIVASEAVGVSAAPGRAGARISAAALAGLRSRAHRLPSLGLTPTRSITVGPMDRLCPGWRESPAGELWAELPRGQVFGVAAPLAQGPGQALMASLACAPRAHDVEAVLDATVPLLVRRTAQCIGPTLSDPHFWLTAREQEVLDLLILGRSVKAIAQLVGRSPHTVHDHVKSLHRKLSATTRGELIARALGQSSVTGSAASQVEPKGRPSRPARARPSTS